MALADPDLPPGIALPELSPEPWAIATARDALLRRCPYLWLTVVSNDSASDGSRSLSSSRGSSFHRPLP